MQNVCSIDAHTEWTTSNKPIILISNKIHHWIIHDLLDVVNKRHVLDRTVLPSLNTVQVWDLQIDKNYLKRLIGFAAEAE